MHHWKRAGIKDAWTAFWQDPSAQMQCIRGAPDITDALRGHWSAFAASLAPGASDATLTLRLPASAESKVKLHNVIGLLRGVGFHILEVCPVGLRPDGGLSWPWFLGRLRAYGYHIAARRSD